MYLPPPPSHTSHTHPPSPPPHTPPSSALIMTSKIPLPVVILVGVVSTLYLLCAMVLLSSIVAWISLDFSPNLAGPLAFIIGSLSLISAIVGILMEGFTRFRRFFGFMFLLLTVGLILTSVGLIVPFIILYNGGNTSLVGEICDDCEQFGKRTQNCVDECNDECCFTDMSEPLATVLIAFTGLSLVASMIGLGTAVAHLFFAFRLPSRGSKKH